MRCFHECDERVLSGDDESKLIYEGVVRRRALYEYSFTAFLIDFASCLDDEQGDIIIANTIHILCLNRG